MFVTNATERVLDKRAWRDQGAFVHKREVPRRWQLSAYSASVSSGTPPEQDVTLVLPLGEPVPEREREQREREIRCR